MIYIKKRLLFVNGHLNVGGVEKSLVDLLKAIDYDKYEVDLVLFEELGDYIDEIPKNVNIKTMNHNGNIIIIVCKIQYLFLINAYAHPSAGTVFQFLLYQVHTYTVR